MLALHRALFPRNTDLSNSFLLIHLCVLKCVSPIKLQENQGRLYVVPPYRSQCVLSYLVHKKGSEDVDKKAQGRERILHILLSFVLDKYG